MRVEAVVATPDPVPKHPGARLSAEAIEQMVADFPLNSMAAFDVVGPGPDQGLRRARHTAVTIKVGGVTNEQPNP